MSKIRDLFHKVGNWHNKISIGAGVTRVELSQKYKNSPVPPEIKNALKRLSVLEQYAVDASKTLNQLKDVIYAIIDPDTGKPKTPVKVALRAIEEKK